MSDATPFHLLGWSCEFLYGRSLYSRQGSPTPKVVPSGGLAVSIWESSIQPDLHSNEVISLFQELRRLPVKASVWDV